MAHERRSQTEKKFESGEKNTINRISLAHRTVAVADVWDLVVGATTCTLEPLKSRTPDQRGKEKERRCARGIAQFTSHRSWLNSSPPLALSLRYDVPTWHVFRQGLGGRCLDSLPSPISWGICWAWEDDLIIERPSSDAGTWPVVLQHTWNSIILHESNGNVDTTAKATTTKATITCHGREEAYQQIFPGTAPRWIMSFVGLVGWRNALKGCGRPKLGMDWELLTGGDRWAKQLRSLETSEGLSKGLINVEQLMIHDSIIDKNFLGKCYDVR